MRGPEHNRMLADLITRVGILVTQYKIYHNPRCSKSRQTLSLLEDAGIQPEIVLYLEHAPSPVEMGNILGKLGISARDLLRAGEPEYKELSLGNLGLSEDQLIAAMCDNPKLIERPIVVRGKDAVLGRPPENVLTLFE